MLPMMPSILMLACTVPLRKGTEGTVRESGKEEEKEKRRGREGKKRDLVLGGNPEENSKPSIMYHISNFYPDSFSIKLYVSWWVMSSWGKTNEQNMQIQGKVLSGTFQRHKVGAFE